MKKWTKFYLCMIVFIYSEKPAFYRQKPRGERHEKIGGANTPPIEATMPRKHGYFRVSAAWLWPGGHRATAGRWCLLVSRSDLSSAGFLVSDPGFDETAFYRWF